MDTTPLVNAQVHNVSLTMSIIVFCAMVVLLAYEWLAGRYKGGKKTKEDWAMAGLALFFLAAVQRPVLTYAVFLIMTLLFSSLLSRFCIAVLETPVALAISETLALAFTRNIDSNSSSFSVNKLHSTYHSYNHNIASNLHFDTLLCQFNYKKGQFNKLCHFFVARSEWII